MVRGLASTVRKRMFSRLTGAEDQTKASGHASAPPPAQPEACSRPEYLSQIFDILFVQLAEVPECDLQSLEFLLPVEEQRHIPSWECRSLRSLLDACPCLLWSCPVRP